MVVSCNHIAFGSIDRSFAGLLVKVDFGPVGIDRTPAAVGIEEDFSLLAHVIGATSVVLDCREPYLPGKLVVRAVGKGVLDTTLAYRLPFDLESALQGLDALLAYEMYLFISLTYFVLIFLLTLWPNSK